MQVLYQVYLKELCSAYADSSLCKKNKGREPQFNFFKFLSVCVKLGLTIKTREVDKYLHSFDDKLLHLSKVIINFVIIVGLPIPAPV